MRGPSEGAEWGVKGTGVREEEAIREVAPPLSSRLSPFSSTVSLHPILY